MTDQELLSLSRDRFLEEESFRERSFDRVKFLWTALVAMGAASAGMARTGLYQDRYWYGFVAASVEFWSCFIAAALFTSRAYRPSRFFKLRTLQTYRAAMDKYVADLVAKGQPRGIAEEAVRTWLRRWHIDAYIHAGSANQLQNLLAHRYLVRATRVTLILPLLLGVQALLFLATTREDLSYGRPRSSRHSDEQRAVQPVDASGRPERNGANRGAS